MNSKEEKGSVYQITNSFDFLLQIDEAVVAPLQKYEGSVRNIYNK